MKRILLGLFSALATISALSVSSCKVDKCKAIVCANNGNCDKDDGSCECPVGFEGERCETVTRDRFIGAYTIDEDGTVSNVARYSASIEAGAQVDQIKIRNFNNQTNAYVYATVRGDSLFIASQSYQVGQITKTVVGYGIITPGETTNYYQHATIRLNYRVSSSDGVVDDFGYQDSGQPSVWVK
ncbi:MAG TPA: calcium-binding EGF-like domain-containing protein [Edaphocola sp.]|nr:calcium-binding EGF-like domain-containing protein [Edaphocola sp.]